jgi:DivIVA domain-containing protein
MSLTPEELERATFPVVKHGYDPKAVDRYLAEVATNVRESDDFLRAGDEVATALRRFHSVIAEMTDEAKNDALRLRTEAEEDALRVRTEAEQEAFRMRTEAVEEARRLRLEVNDEVARLRADAEREREELLTHAQEEVQKMLEDARTEREDAKRIAAAVDETVKAKRAEFEEYLVAVTSLAESTARARVESVLDGYRAEVERLAAARAQTSAALQVVRTSLEQAVMGLGDEVDLRERPPAEEPPPLQPPPLDAEAVDEAVAHALRSTASPVDGDRDSMF